MIAGLGHDGAALCWVGLYADNPNGWRGGRAQIGVPVGFVRPDGGHICIRAVFPDV